MNATIKKILKLKIFLILVLFDFSYVKLDNNELRSAGIFPIKMSVKQLFALSGTPLNQARSLYYMLIGYPSDLQGVETIGPEFGLIGWVNSYLEDPELVDLLVEEGIESCSQLPTSGSISNGNISVTFSSGKKRIPSHFTFSSGARFHKRLKIRNGFSLSSTALSYPVLVDLELSCQSGNVSTAYIAVDAGAQFELYYQTLAGSKQHQIDAYFKDPNSSTNEKLAIRFEHDNGSHFDLWSVRTTTSALHGSDGVALSGDDDLKIAEVRTVSDVDTVPDDFTSLETGIGTCVDIETGALTLGCSTIQAAAGTVHGSAFSIAGVYNSIYGSVELLQPNSSIADFGAVSLGSTSLRTVILSNLSGADIANLSTVALNTPFQFYGGSYPGTGGTCSSSVVSGASCTIVIEYTPSAASVSSEDLLVSYENSFGNTFFTRVGLEGTAVSSSSPAILNIAGVEPHDFGTLLVGSTSSISLNISNIGNQPATALSESTLAAPFGFLGGAYPGVGGTCTATLAASSSCFLVIEYNPSVAGSLTGQLTLNYNNSMSLQNVTRTFIGVATSPVDAVLRILGTGTHDFGNVGIGLPVNQIFTVQNVGAQTASSMSGATLEAPFSFTGGSYPGASGSCGVSLTSGSSCQLDVTVSPTVAGAFSEVLQINYNDGVIFRSTSRPLMAFGVNVPPGEITITEASPYDFGNLVVGATSNHIFMISNTGPGDASALSVTSLMGEFNFTGGSFPGTAGDCTTLLTSGNSCSLDITYSPGSVGFHGVALAVDFFNGTVTQNTVIALNGNGLAAATLNLSETDPFDFGTVSTGGSTVHLFTLANVGSEVASAINEVGLSAPFTFTGVGYPGTNGDCSANLTPGTSCTLEIIFSPMVLGPLTGSLSVSYFDGAITQTVVRSLSGTGSSPSSAILSISESEPYSFGGVLVGGSASHTFTVSNTGSATATSITEAGLSAPFSFAGGLYPGTSGTCSTSLAAATSCTLDILVNPGVATTVTGTINLSYNDGVASQSTLRGLSVTGQTPAVLSLSGADPVDFGTIATSSTSSVVLVLSNTGTGTASSISEVGLAAPFGFSGGAYPGVAGDCGANLAGGSSCNLELSFSPLTTGLQLDAVEISYNDGLNAMTLSRNIRGTGGVSTFAVLTLSEVDPYDYGAVANGSSANHLFTVTNTGGVSATFITETGLAAPYSFAGGSYPGTLGTCTATLASGSSCFLDVQFSPTSLGVQTGTLSLSYNDSSTTQLSSRSLTGEGASLALLSISDAEPYDFGNLTVGANSNKVFTITNTGGVSATALSESTIAPPFSYFGGGGYPGLSGTCGTTLNPGSSCTINTEFTPIVTGAVTGAVTFSYNNGATVQSVVRNLQGAGTTAAVLSLTEADPYDYGSVVIGNSSGHIFTLSNSGGSLATVISEVGLAAPFGFTGGSFPGTGGDCSGTLSPASSCTLDVSYSPLTSGAHTDGIIIDYYDGTNSQQVSRNVQGTGTVPTQALLSISESDPYSFGVVLVGSTEVHTFTVQNVGGATATLISAAALTTPYSFVGGSYPGVGGDCGVSLASASSCTIVVEVAPSAIGSFNESLSLSYNDSVITQSVVRTMTAVASNPAILTISGVDPYDYGSVTVGTGQSQTFFISNVGDVAATSINEVALAVPFTFSGGSFPGSGGNCTATLASSSTCSVVVEFTPSTVGAHNGNIDIQYNNGINTQSVLKAVQGAGL